MATSNAKSSQSCGGNANSKRQKFGTLDRISNLPNSVLLHILSFLPIKNVVQTGILSKRFERLWTNVPSLNFDEYLYSSSRDYSRRNGKRITFANFVNRVLLQYNGGSIRKFRIDCGSNPVDVQSWVKKAIALDVQELDVDLSYLKTFHLPRSTFTCETLVVLKLCGEIMVVVPSSPCIPNLKTLHLDSVTYQDGESASRLISCCLVLENLYIRRKKFDNVKKFRISAQALKRLAIDVPKYSRGFDGYKCVLDINAPALQNLDIIDCISERLLFSNAGSLNKANVELGKTSSCQSLIKCFEAFNNVRFLSLSGGTSTPLNLQPGLLSAKLLNLTHFTMEARCVWNPLLPCFLQCFENLEVLTLTKDSWYHSCNVDNLWTEPEHVPRCLLSCLREIRLETFHEPEYKLGMLKYILRNGKVLEMVEIHHTREEYYNEYPMFHRRRGKVNELQEKVLAAKSKFLKFQEKFCLVQKILKFPRGSETCEITFS